MYVEFNIASAGMQCINQLLQNYYWWNLFVLVSNLPQFIQ